MTLTKVEDLLLSLTDRSTGDRPCVVLDPFGLAEGVADELIWDPIAGCVDPKIAERRAKAFTAGTVKGAINGGTGDDAARFYAAEAAKVLQAYFHAAALTGQTLEDVLRWVANPAAATEPERDPAPPPARRAVLARPAARRAARRRPHRRQHHHHRPAGHEPVLPRRRSVAAASPDPAGPATDLADVIRRRGTIYLLGREDPYASASPLMTAVAEHVLDTGLRWPTPRPGAGGCARRCSPASTSCPPPRRCRRCGPGWPTSEHSGCRSSGPRRPAPS